MSYRFSFKIMVRIDNTVIHFVIKREDFILIRNIPKNRITLVANHNIFQFLEQTPYATETRQTMDRSRTLEEALSTYTSFVPDDPVG